MFKHVLWAASLIAFSGASDSAQAGTLSTIASCLGWGCTGLIANASTLLFTSYQADPGRPDSASFYRTTKNGGGEVLLYQETGDRSGIYYFGKPAYANSTLRDVPSNGYFAANYNDFGVPTSQIKRVSLAGGPAVVLATAPQFIGVQDFRTDGARLFWADRYGLRSMSVTGGAIQTLVAFPDMAPSQLALSGNLLYFSFGNQIRRIPKTGGVSVIVTTAPDIITDLYVYGPQWMAPELYWGEANGGVRSLDAWGFQHTFQDSMNDRQISDVGFDGNRVLWIDCEKEGFTCVVKAKQGAAEAVQVAFEDSPATNLVWDSTSMYWTNSTSIRRYVH
jgi:hypothetical protein